MAFGKEDGNTSDDSVCHTIVESRDLLYAKLPQRIRELKSNPHSSSVSYRYVHC